MPYSNIHSYLCLGYAPGLLEGGKNSNYKMNLP